MSVARKDDRHNEDLVAEIADNLNRRLSTESREDAGAQEQEREQPRFVVTGDRRVQPRKRGPQ
ncbi:hypothetical protein [Amycolatopsis cihanbeyliensis]|uniref:Uncharacterized protein n=1 Tax=Amycolatopsis cihanbeyliensis TaxID=1128664 RepID=A0A542DP17_AMYCI|nr:hypothetical protein [Amycolatopsis cihanbeyliensis]TQJ04807.1 hypothetical protein FB471_4616 [Amycolatopsis cihanbeyliensis]